MSFTWSLFPGPCWSDAAQCLLSDRDVLLAQHACQGLQKGDTNYTIVLSQGVERGIDLDAPDHNALPK